MLDFIRLGRPTFLIGGLTFHALGATLALLTGHPLDAPTFLLGQIAITAAQLATHYSNDYFDLPGDRVNRNLTFWSGGSRVLPDGKLPPRAALAGALACLGMSLAAILALFLLSRPPLVALGLLLAGNALSWAYSAPPIRLVARGLGELTAAVVVPGLTTLIGLTLQRGVIGPIPLLVIAPLMLFQFSALLAVEFPDLEADRATGKRTLPVVLGGERAALLHTIVLVLAYQVMLAALLLMAVSGEIAVALAVLAIWLIALPVGLWHGSRVAGGSWCDPLQWGSVAFWGFALLIGTAGLEVAAFTWLAIQRGAPIPFVG